MRGPYFAKREDQPAPLGAVTQRKVRFQELDPLGIVWHGHYASYFEDARVEFGMKYGIGYMEFYRNGVVAPIKKMYMDYHRPLRFQEDVSIEARLHWSEAARMDFEFIIRNGQGDLATTGYTVQLMLDLNNNLLLIPPPFYLDFRNRWKTGGIS